jgi:hypothetical protein
VSRISYYLGNRLFEWAMSVPIVLLSGMLFIWPQITSAPAFRLFAWALPSPLIGVSLMICGVACIVALLVNGASMVLGPRVRSWAAGARALLWLQFGISTLQAGIEQGYPYTVLPFWFTFALAELWVAYRAVLDVRSPH